MTNDKNKSEVRSIGGLLLQMKLDPNPEMRILAQELIVNEFEDIEKELAQEKELSLQFDNKYWSEVALHEKTKAELAAANEELFKIRKEHTKEILEGVTKTLDLKIANEKLEIAKGLIESCRGWVLTYQMQTYSKAAGKQIQKIDDFLKLEENK